MTADLLDRLPAFVCQARCAILRNHTQGEREDVTERRLTYRSGDGSLLFTQEDAGLSAITSVEHVHMHGRLVWTAHFLGGVTDLCHLDPIQAAKHFRTGQLGRLTHKGPWPRGGISFDGFRYACLQHGTVACGFGEEQLFADAYLIYHVHFRHQAIL